MRTPKLFTFIISLACSIFLLLLSRSPPPAQTTNNAAIVSKPVPPSPEQNRDPPPPVPQPKKYMHLRRKPWYLPWYDELDELSQEQKVPRLVSATKLLLEKHSQVIFAGDSTIRQLLFGWVGMLKALEEGIIVENEVGTEWTSERWMEEIMEGCPSSQSDWERKENQHLVGERCAYGDTQIIQDFRGTSEVSRNDTILSRFAPRFLITANTLAQDPEAMNTQFKYCDNKGGANLKNSVYHNGEAMEKKGGRRLVVVNFRTLHLLHYYPVRLFEDYVVLNGLMDEDKFVAFFEKELRDLLSVLDSWGGGTLVYKTTSAVCNSAYTGEYEEIMKSWEEGREYVDKKTGRGISRGECDSYVEASFPEGKWSEKGACLDTRLSMSGSSRMYDLEMAAFEKVVGGINYPYNTDSFLVLLDAYDLTADNCDMTHDGRHFPKMSIALIYALSKGLTKLYGFYGAR